MGSLRFRRSVKLGPGVQFNLGKKSMGLSVGTRGARYSVSTSGRRTTSVGIPGSGLAFTQTGSARKSASRSTAKTRKTIAPNQTTKVAKAPKPGLLAPAAEKRFFEGVQAYVKEDHQRAFQAFEAASAKDNRNISDDFFAGIVASRLDDPKAITYLERVVSSDISLPDKLMQKYLPGGVSLTVNITPRIQALVDFSSFGATLILAEMYQVAGRLEEAIGLIQQLAEADANNIGVKLSLCDLLFEDGDYDGVVTAAIGAANDSNMGLACLHLKAKALAKQGLNDAAVQVFADCVKRTAGRDAELLKEIRYDRAQLYQDIGQASRARAEWQKLYADDPKFRDVADRVRAN